MRVNVLGAGPAGLYLGILLKKADRRHEISITERNPPAATFGWGVVFSEETLGALRDADYPTYLEITDTFARWDAIDIHYQGRLLRSRGHGFAAIARKRLLNILQRRCAELGVRLRFGTEVEDPAELADGADLLVAADGVHSLVRDRYAEAFGATVVPQGGRYAWFGTDLVLDAFTFIFRQTEHGLFQVHSYPFDEHTSTFIVECPERTWRSAGLDRMSEQDSIRFCADLFADDLRGHRLMSNRSTWNSFLRVTNRTWRLRNLVLLGDAAHTAHFSIGSGTKLAMEDAIALVNSLIKHQDPAAALVDYEQTRQPVVARFQQAADDSAEYFQRVGRHTDLAPVQFAFNLLTRSGRIGHAALTVRDPEFTGAVDAFCHGGGATVGPPPAFAALRLPGLDLANRIVRTGAADGAGLVLGEPVAVRPDGRITPETPTLHTDADMLAAKSTVDKAHAAGARFGLCLTHAGRRASTRPWADGIDLPLTKGWPTVAASALRYTPALPVPRELTGADLAELAEQFGTAAGRAAEAGADLLELDLAGGYLLAGFLSPLTNRRADAHGGQLEHRLRFPLAVVDAVRAAWPADRLLAARLTVTDWAPGGLTVDDGVRIAGCLAAHGIGLIRVTAGQTVAEGRPEYRRGYLTSISDRVRSEAGVPTMVGGYLTRIDEVNTVVGAGRADLCLLSPAPEGRR
jgi:anthraniloyl-CoA monooxygenase